MAREGNLSNYLDLINQPNYLVLVAAKSDTGTYFSDELHGKMDRGQRLGVLAQICLQPRLFQHPLHFGGHKLPCVLHSIVLLADGDPSAYMTPGMQTALASKELGLSR